MIVESYHSRYLMEFFQRHDCWKYCSSIFSVPPVTSSGFQVSGQQLLSFRLVISRMTFSMDVGMKSAKDEAMSVILLSAYRVGPGIIFITLQADSLPVIFSGVGCYLTLPFLDTHASSVEADGTDVISSSMSLDLPDDEDEYVS
ncbi:hypothetical protein T11_2284 [Trichinella zimbabwensis]|uniref:Uncharacterized protein n=1 Tax=Trichinella zimbabwensis TaxID=268475 RepID=A0A0V1HDH6_9BILA|nr:hypothetical protein T11_2284 [Trichinella zimbabwensis]